MAVFILNVCKPSCARLAKTTMHHKVLTGAFGCLRSASAFVKHVPLAHSKLIICRLFGRQTFIIRRLNEHEIQRAGD